MTATTLKPPCKRRGCTRRSQVRDYCLSCYNVMRAYGQLPTRLVDAAPARQWIEQQVARGRTRYDTARAAGVVRDTVYRILSGQQARVSAGDLAAILAVPLPPTTVGMVRRVHALARAGWTRDDVAREAGVNPAALRAAMTRRRFHPGLAQAVAAAYERIPTDRPGPSPHVAKLAATRGLLPAMAWEGVDIDDPDATPLGVRRIEKQRNTRAQLRASRTTTTEVAA